MAEAKPKKTQKPREMRPSTLLNHVEGYCRDNELGQEDQIQLLIDALERDIINEAKRGG